MNKIALPTLGDVLDVVSDKYSLALLDVIATSGGREDLFAETLQMTRKQFYNRIAGLTTYGLIKGRNGKLL